MQLTVALSASSPDQIRIAIDVFSTLMDIEVHSSETSWPAPQRSTIISAVSFSKGWEGAMLIEFDMPLAFMIAEKMMGVEIPNAISEDDIKDALGELANMIGGNLKALMPPETCLSMPWISQTGGDTGKQPGGTQLTHVVLEVESGKCQLSLIEGRAQPDTFG